MKALILDRNADYTQRLQYYMNKKNPDLQISACDSVDAAKSLMENERFDVILVDPQFEEFGAEDVDKLCDDTAFAYISGNNEIVKETGASTATVSRVKRCLNYGADGYKLVLERMEK